MVAAAKAAIPVIGDLAAALQLENFAKATTSALVKLRAAFARAADISGNLEIDCAIEIVKGLSQELVEKKGESQQGKLVPLPGSVESCALELRAATKSAGSSIAQLMIAANQGKGKGEEGRSRCCRYRSVVQY